MKNFPKKSTFGKIKKSKYNPHQGKKEKIRRIKQMKKEVTNEIIG